jgi:hypothetical protein
MPRPKRTRCEVERLDTRLVLSYVGVHLNRTGTAFPVVTSLVRNVGGALASVPATTAESTPSETHSIDTTNPVTLTDRLTTPTLARDYLLRAPATGLQVTLILKDWLSANGLHLQILDSARHLLEDLTVPPGTQEVTTQVRPTPEQAGQSFFVRVLGIASSLEGRNESFTLEITPIDSASSDLASFVATSILPVATVGNNVVPTITSSSLSSSTGVSLPSLAAERLGQSGALPSAISKYGPPLGPDPLDAIFGRESSASSLADRALSSDPYFEEFASEGDSFGLPDALRSLVDAPGGPPNGSYQLVDGEVRLVSRNEVDAALEDAYGDGIGFGTSLRRRAMVEGSGLGLILQGGPVVGALAAALLFVNVVVLDGDLKFVKRLLCRRTTQDGPRDSDSKAA